MVKKDQVKDEGMFDLYVEDDRQPWEDEPSLEEVLVLIRALKKEIIDTYLLPAKSDLTLQIPKPYNQCQDSDERILNTFWQSARKNLEMTVPKVKKFIPKQYYFLFDQLLVDWLPVVE